MVSIFYLYFIQTNVEAGTIKTKTRSVYVLFSPVQHCDHSEPGCQRGEDGRAEEDCG